MPVITFAYNAIRMFTGYFYTFLISVLTITSTPFYVLKEYRPADFWIHHWARVIRAVSGMKITVEGREHLIKDRPCVFIANHQSMMDIIVLFTITSNSLRMVLKKELLYVPVFGWSLWWMRFIAIDRGKRRKALQSIDKGAERIRKGTSVLLFPEGTRSADGTIRPFQAGSFIMAIKSQVPVVPITISGTIKVVHKKKPFAFSWNREVRIIVAPPIDTTEYALKDRDLLRDRVESVIRSNYEGIKHLSLG